jgi:hypothetical protein
MKLADGLKIKILINYLMVKNQHFYLYLVYNEYVYDDDDVLQPFCLEIATIKQK